MIMGSKIGIVIVSISTSTMQIIQDWNENSDMDKSRIITS